NWSQKLNIPEKTGYGWFTCRLGRFTRRQPLAAAALCGTGGLTATRAVDPSNVTSRCPNSMLNYDLTSANLVTSGILAVSLLVFSRVISRCIPSELPDPFSESPSELSTKPTTSSEPRPDAQA
ncbi:hypothetical protein B296_00017641, partial [Ensete ventricosum]